MPIFIFSLSFSYIVALMRHARHHRLNGKDTALSRLKCEFDSHWWYFRYYSIANTVYRFSAEQKWQQNLWGCDRLPQGRISERSSVGESGGLINRVSLVRVQPLRLSTAIASSNFSHRVLAITKNEDDVAMWLLATHSS